MENYSEYDTEQIMELSGYPELCNYFLSLAKDDAMREKLSGILYGGGYQGYDIFGHYGRNDELMEAKRRAGVAYQLVTNPNTFDELGKNNVIYYHGTSSMALPSILKYGLNSYDKSITDGLNIRTGEEWSRNRGRDFVSFTDVLDVAIDYAIVNSNENAFPVVVGTSLDNIRKTYRKPVSSELPEIGVKNHFPKELISCILVPADKVSMVKEMVGDGIKVLPADLREEKFYSVDLDSFQIYVDDNRYNELIGKSGYTR